MSLYPKYFAVCTERLKGRAHSSLKLCCENEHGPFIFRSLTCCLWKKWTTFPMRFRTDSHACTWELKDTSCRHPSTETTLTQFSRYKGSNIYTLVLLTAKHFNNLLLTLIFRWIIQNVGLKIATNLFVRVPTCLIFRGRPYQQGHGISNKSII